MTMLTRSQTKDQRIASEKEGNADEMQTKSKKRQRQSLTEKKGLTSEKIPPKKPRYAQATFPPKIPVPHILPRKAPVPRPAIQNFGTIVGGKKSVGRSADAQLDMSEAAALHAARMWLKYAPTYRIPGADLFLLKKRPKNGKEDIELADATIAGMQNLQADACSARFVDDRSGKTLVCVFSHRMPAAAGAKDAEGALQLAESSALEPKEKKAPLYPGAENRTLKDIQKVAGPYWDGIPDAMRERYHQVTQMLHSILPPHANKRDIRHPCESVMMYSHEPMQGGAEYVRDGVGDAGHDGVERTGVTHLVHAWHQQGRLNHIMTHSKDMSGRGACCSEMAVRGYFEGSRPVATYLSACFQVAFPDYYRKYKAAFEAGVWMKEDPGPWLGRAIVWKLPVKTHVDGLDEGPTAIFNTGNYTGGQLYLPDLKLKLEYDPGTAVIFLSGQLYHCVSEWKPGLKAAGDKVTPGRVGNVFFFPKASFDKLWDKPPGWNWKTMTGTAPDVSKSKIE